MGFYPQGSPPVHNEHFLLLNGFASPFAKRYRISSIPQIMVFKKGQPVSMDAPRPSSPALKRLVKQQLGG